MREMEQTVNVKKEREGEVERNDTWRVFKAGGWKSNANMFPPKDWMDKHMFFPSIDLHEFW